MIPPMSAPINCFDSIRICMKGYCNYNGRARRSEFWYFYILCMIIEVILVSVLSAFRVEHHDRYGYYYYTYSDSVIGYVVFLIIFEIFMWIPLFAASTRRLHDIDRSGSYNFIIIIPFGIIYLWYLWAIDSHIGPSIYGPSPKYNAGVNDPLVNNPGVPVVQPVPAPVISVAPVVSPVVQVAPVTPAYYGPQYPQQAVPVQPNVYQGPPPDMNQVPQQPNVYQGPPPVDQGQQQNYEYHDRPPSDQQNNYQGQAIPVGQPNMYTNNPQGQYQNQPPEYYPPPNLPA